MMEFIQQGTTVTIQVYCKMLSKLHKAIQNKGHGMLTSSIVFLYDDACPLTAARTQALLKHSPGSCLSTPLIAQISLQATTA
jgi:hypothetical protein